MEKYLALVFIIKEANFDRPYLVEENVEVFRRGLADLLNATTEASDAETSQIVARAQREFQAIFLRYAVGLPPLPDLDFSQMSLADPQEN